jgi:TolB protein
LSIARYIALVVLVATSVLVSGSSHSAANAAAAQFFLPGKLAYVQNGSLYVLDGDSHTVHRLTYSVKQLAATTKVLSPTWSHDGRWLAYVLTDLSSSQVWIRRADGSGARTVTPLGFYTNEFAWSPTSDVLAVAGAYGPRGGIHLVPVQGPVRTVAAGLDIESLAWAPGGKQLAFTAHPSSSHGNLPDVLSLVTFPGLRVTTWYTLPRRDGSYMQLVGWWPDGKGVLYWLDPLGSASLAADGMMLYNLHRSGKPKPLVTTLGYPDWVRMSGGSALVVQGSYRATYDNKWLTLCTETSGSCRTLLRPAGSVAIDPAWQPGGHEIAFVKARSLTSMGGFTKKVGAQQWLDTNHLLVASAGGAGASQIRAAGGDAHAPVWSSDGRGLLFVSHDVLWYDAHVGAGNAVRVVPLFVNQSDMLYPGMNWSLFYYGHLDWHMLFAWYQ